MLCHNPPKEPPPLSFSQREGIKRGTPTTPGQGTDRTGGGTAAPNRATEKQSTERPRERIKDTAWGYQPRSKDKEKTGGTGMNRSSRWPYVRRMAWDRDRKQRNVCHICNQPINYFLQPSSCDDAWEPDHIIPVAKDPSLELDLNNIKASHRRCNRSRGDGTNGENVLGMQSRMW